MASCAYAECTRNRRKNSNLSFFRIPTDNRRNEWLINCGNIKLYDLSEEQLREKRVCALHFADKHFINSNKNRLVHDAVPVHYKNGASEKVTTNIIKKQSPKKLDFIKQSCPRVYGKKDSLCSFFPDNLPKEQAVLPALSNSSVENTFVTQTLVDMPISTKKIGYEASALTYRKRIRHLEKKLKMKNVLIFRYRKKIINNAQNANRIDNILPVKSKSVRTFINMQLFHKRRHPWKQEEKELSLSLYYKSPSLYLFMRETLKFVLPSKSTITSWLRISQLNTGTETELFKKLAVKVDSMSIEEKQCVLLFDEIGIKKHLEYNARQDIIEGFQDLGHLGRSNEIATHALVFMIRGLLHNWKLPVSYYFSSYAVKHDSLRELLLKVIRDLQTIGLHVRVTTCDQATTNRAVYCQLDVTEERPYFFVNQQKIFAMYDVPHLIKSVRNNLMARDIQDQNGTVSWSDIEKAYLLDKSSNTARAAVKLTDKHIKPNTFEKMRVKYATQIFSNTVSALITTALKTEQLHSTTATNTAMFLKKINDLFDILNSHTLYSRNPNSCALSVRFQRNEHFLVEALNWVASWKIYGKNNKVKEGIYCLKGFILSIQTAIQLWRDLKTQNYEFLLTSRLNQDPLENLFSALRRKGGHCLNPTAKAFRQALQFNMFIRLQKPVEKSNCEDDHDETITLNDNFHADQQGKRFIVSKEEVEEQIPDDTSEFQPKVLPALNCIDVASTLEECAVVYFAGYLAYKTLKQFHNCVQCTSTMCSDDILNATDQFFLLQKDYGMNASIRHLKTPSDLLKNIVYRLLLIFSDYFQNKKALPNFKSSLLTLSINNMNKFVPGWLDKDEKCYEHKLFVIKHLISCKLNKELKWISQDLRSVGQYNRKVKNVTNR